MAEATARVLGGLVVRSFGDGAPVVLFHGGTGSWTHWSRNIQALAARLRVHALDLPGYGAAPSPPSGPDPVAYLHLVSEAVSTLAREEGPLRLVGFSFGGAVSAAIARCLGPDCAAWAGIGPGGFGEAKDRRLDQRQLPPPDDPGYRAVVRHNLLTMMLAKPESVDEATIDLQCANIAQARFDSRRVSLRATLAVDLAAVAAPVMAIWGQADQLAWPSVEARAERLRAARPDARIALVPGAGHWAQYEAPASVNALLTDFLLLHAK
jgi:pimeloyl-ACP methyl ester carboxylesterase